MPSKSPAQARIMRAAAHNREFAKKVGISSAVAREFNAADKRAAVPQRLLPSSKRR